VKKRRQAATIVYFSAHPGASLPANLLKTKNGLWSHTCQIKERDFMIIFVLTVSVLSLLALTLTGSIASGTHRRQ
jgi:hypothetical protein